MTILLESISGLVGVDGDGVYFFATASCSLGCITREDILSSETPFPSSKRFDFSKDIKEKCYTQPLKFLSALVLPFSVDSILDLMLL